MQEKKRADMKEIRKWAELAFEASQSEPAVPAESFDIYSESIQKRLYARLPLFAERVSRGYETLLEEFASSIMNDED